MVKQTYRKVRSVAVISIIAALFTGLMWPYAIEQSKTQITDWLADTALMLDVSVILTVEVVVQMAFCMLAAHVMTSGRLKKRTIWLYKALRWFPGVLIFPVLFSALVWAIFSFPGRSFSMIAWTMAVIVLIVIPSGSYAVRWLLPEKELRLEIFFLSNALTAVLGIIATVNGRTAVAGINNVDWTALAALFVILLVGGIIGLVAYNHRKVKIKW